VIIDAATIADAQELAEVHVRSWQAAYGAILSSTYLQGLSTSKRAEQWVRILERQESVALVARDRTGVAGFVSFGAWRAGDAQAPAEPDHGEIWALYVHPRAWGQGVGRALLSAAVAALRDAGRHRVSLWVLSENHRGLRFYRAAGFVPVVGSATRIEVGGMPVEEIRLELPAPFQAADAGSVDVVGAPSAARAPC
jgi:ribosomal protein S18 acetylase RimI-like enzyme